MSITELASRNAPLGWALSLAVLILGWIAFDALPRLADPRLAVREAWVITPYPGASPEEVEREVSERIEQVARRLEQVRRVDSYSSRDLSIVRVVTENRYDKKALPQVWDELQRRIDNAQPGLPPGAGPSTVEDEIGDICSLYYGLAGTGFTPAELNRIAEPLRRELSTIEGVKKVVLFGKQQEVVLVEISLTKANALGLGLDEIFEVLRSKNLSADAGRIQIGPEHVAISPSGLFRSVRDLGDLMIAGNRDQLVRLADIADVRRDYEDPPRAMLHIDGRPAIGIAISAAPGADLVALGKAVEQRLAQMTADMPLGMDLIAIALEPSIVAETIGTLSTRMFLALILVLATLLLFMGPRGGFITALATLLTLAATFITMDYLQVPLDRISTGTLILVSGILTSNSIFLVHDSGKMRDQGPANLAGAQGTVARNALPLLASTAVAVLAIAPIGGMEGGAAEYARGLFLVVLISLPIGWVTALTITPPLAHRFLRSSTYGTGSADPHDTRALGLYTRVLAAAILRRWTLLGATVLVLALSIVGLSFVKKTFFPPAATSSFLVEVYFREGTHIRETERQLGEIETYLRNQVGVIHVATAIGAGHPTSVYAPRAGPDVGSQYGASLVLVDGKRPIEEIRHRVQTDLAARHPDAIVNAKRHATGPKAAGGGIQLRISGPNPTELRRMADQIQALIATDPDTKAIRDDWGVKVKVAQPVLAGEQAHRLDIDRARISRALRTAYSGTVTGFFREGAELLPILAKTPKGERDMVEDMANIEVTSPLRGDRVSMRRLADRLDTLIEDARRIRRGGQPTITVYADADRGPTSELFGRFQPQVEKALDLDLAVTPSPAPGAGRERGSSPPGTPDGTIPIRNKPGYSIGWGGEAGEQASAWAELRAWIPLYFGALVLILIAQFGALRQPLIVLATASLSVIGATAGLLLTGQPFDFMSLLGYLGLAGIVMGSAILLVNQIDIEIRTSEARPTAILRAAGGRLRPIALATGASIVAMLPLLDDDLFASIAVTMVFGLAIAIPLTMILAPALYAALFGLHSDETP